LGDAFPNPARAGSDVRYGVPAGTSFALDVVDVRGRRVRRLLAGEGPRRDVGRWDGRDGDGARVAAGVYFFRLSTAVGVVSEKVVTLR
ncbi:T9SS type A sorting domain-containing protein, partial [bacterium]|nr:T9SS type A sorting domain-containing protein [bacterium]